MTELERAFLLALVGAACGGKVDYFTRRGASGGSGSGGVAMGLGGAAGIGGRTVSTGGRRSGPNGLGGSTGGTLESGGAPGGGVASTGGSEPAPPTGGGAGCNRIIDDMESGTGFICEGEGRRGYWYAINDSTGRQEPSPADSGVPILPEAVAGGRHDSTRAMHTRGAGFTGWGAGIGFFLDSDGQNYGAYDASERRGIGFYARSDQGTVLHVRVNSVSTTSTDYGGTCTKTPSGALCNPYAFDVALSSEWALYEVAFSDILHGVCPTVDPGQITGIEFMGSWQEESPSFDFWIDDVIFLPRTGAACGQSCVGNISFDPSLEAAIRSVNGRHTGSLGSNDVCDITHLCAGDRDIKSLDGLECLTNLTALDLADNAIVDLEPLGGLTQLTWLALSDNQITDIGPLGNLTELTWLSLYDNGIESIEPLAKLVNLLTLSAYNNRIVDLGPLSGLKSLNWLSLSNNRITALDGLAGATGLYSLSLDYNDISELSPLADLPFLHLVDLRGNQIQTVGPLVTNSGLGSDDDIYLDENPIDCAADAANLNALASRGVRLFGPECYDED